METWKPGNQACMDTPDMEICNTVEKYIIYFHNFANNLSITMATNVIDVIAVNNCHKLDSISFWT